MRIVFYIEQFLNVRGGGAERSLADLMNEMISRGHDVTLVIREPETRIDKAPFYEIHPAIRIRNLCPWASAIPSNSGYAAGKGVGGMFSRLHNSLGKRLRTTTLRDEIEGLAPDLVVVFLVSHFAFANQSMGKLDVPLVLCHRNDPVAKLAELAAKRSHRLDGIDAAHKRAALVTVQMNAYRLALPPAIQAKTIIIPNVSKMPAVRDSSLSPQQENLILSVGRLASVKNHSLLVNAFASLAKRYPHWSVEIYGDGPEHKALQTLITSLGLEGRVQLKGTVVDIDKAYSRARIFAFPSHYEGFARALAEAMAHSLPSICLQRCTFCREIIEKSGGGLLTENEVASFAAAIETMISSEELRRDVGAKACAHISAYAPDAIYDLWEAAFERAKRVLPDAG